jgi:AcrR family transcriptional regulator
MAVAARSRRAIPQSRGSSRELDRGDVAEFQQARLVAALVEVVDERGIGEVTVADVVKRSGVSRRTFYELFDDREACFTAAFEEAVRRAGTRVVPVFGGPGSWRERVRAALQELLGFLEDEPGLGALCVIDALSAGPGPLARREQIVQVLIDAVDEGRGQARVGPRPTRLTAEAVVGAVLAILHTRLGARRFGEGSSLMDLLGPLMGIVVLPYFGQAAATQEANKPAMQRERVMRPLEVPLRELEMRLTYRTLRVLLAIASAPGASNRRIAEAAGVTDQGQISKLLARLEHLGLIANHSDGHIRGEPNAWDLTPRGRQIEHLAHR